MTIRPVRSVAIAIVVVVGLTIAVFSALAWFTLKLASKAAKGLL